MRPVVAPLLLVGVLASACLPPEWGANAILHPTRRFFASGASVRRAERSHLFGASLGAAVALQAAPDEPRVRGVIASLPSPIWTS